MKFGASSSIIILDYDDQFEKFRVLKRVEVPKSEYSYDMAIKTIVKLNEIYNPSWIYVDAGAGEIFAQFWKSTVLKFQNLNRTKSVKTKAY